MTDLDHTVVTPTCKVVSMCGAVVYRPNPSVMGIILLRGDTAVEFQTLDSEDQMNISKEVVKVRTMVQYKQWVLMNHHRNPTSAEPQLLPHLQMRVLCYVADPWVVRLSQQIFD